jgi:hypothetical protein
MDNLPDHVLAHVGSFLDINSRLHCTAAAKMFQCIHHSYNAHTVKLNKSPNLETHLPYIKLLKPRCEIIRFFVETDDISCTTIDGLQSVTEYVNTHFQECIVSIKYTSMHIIEKVLDAIKHWKCKILYIIFNSRGTISEQLLTLIRWHTSMCQEFHFWITTNQLSILKDTTITPKLKHVMIDICKPEYVYSPICVYTHLLDHASICLRTNYDNIAISKPENIERIEIYDMIQDYDRDWSRLLKSFKNMGASRSKLKMLVDLDNNKKEQSGPKHVLSNFWYTFFDIIPKQNVQFGFLMSHDKLAALSLIRVMCKRIGANNVVVFYRNKEECLAAKVVHHFNPGLSVKALESHQHDEMAAQHMSLNAIYQEMSDYQKLVWCWLSTAM